MSGWKKTVLIGLILCSCIGCDQATKNVARETLRFAPIQSFLDDSVHLLYTENPGVAFSLGARLPEHFRLALVILGVGTVLLVLGIYTFRHIDATREYLVGASLVIGGGLGNLIDRIVNEGRVIDFIMIRVGAVQTAVFNVADMCIFTGMVLLLYGMYQMHREAQQRLLEN